MNAAQLLSAHLELVAADAERWLGLFADDAVVEFPYAASLGAPARLEGRDAIRDHFARALTDFEGLTFSNVRLYPTAGPDVALLEARGAARVRSTGRRYEQDYVMVATARGGRIAHYREYWNPLAVVASFGAGRLPGGAPAAAAGGGAGRRADSAGGAGGAGR